MTAQWTAQALAKIAHQTLPEAPLIDPATVSPILPGIDLWDYWPVQELSGAIAQIAGGELMMLLSATSKEDPDARHAVARIRLMHRTTDGWTDLGLAFPDNFTPGSREWSGSTAIDSNHSMLTMYFTAAGVRGESQLGFEQRMFVTTAAINEALLPVIGGWSDPVEVIAADNRTYMREMSGGGALGTIKAFRDPYFFRDPHDGRDYLLFTASLARSESPWNGAIGVAVNEGGNWHFVQPLITADGVNNELERPHIIVHSGLYYCFWSTQTKVFADGGPAGPTGLYGVVADCMAGPWRPLNDSGLVIANPAARPHQAYSWLVRRDLSVLSFVDLAGLDRAPINVAEARRHFGGTPAPDLRLTLDGDRAHLL